MVEWFDETVGDLVAYIDRKGLAGNTLFLYVADNGWVQLEDQQPLAATRAKLSPYDAGLRTPIFVRWKGRIEPRRDDRHLVSSIDIAPTIAAAAGLKIPMQWPGIDLRDSRKVASRHTAFGATFVHTSIDIAKPAANVKYRWMIRDQWKLIVPHQPNLHLPVWENQPAGGWSERIELFDLSSDPHEKNDLAASHPNVVRSMLTELDRWWRP
jgi:uncharacterized sulfatase